MEVGRYEDLFVRGKGRNLIYIAMKGCPAKQGCKGTSLAMMKALEECGLSVGKGSQRTT